MSMIASKSRVIKKVQIYFLKLEERDGQTKATRLPGYVAKVSPKPSENERKQVLNLKGTLCFSYLVTVDLRYKALSCLEASVAMQKQKQITRPDAFRGHCLSLLDEQAEAHGYRVEAFSLQSTISSS